MTTQVEKEAAYDRMLEFLRSIGTLEIREFDSFGNKDGKLACYLKEGGPKASLDR